MGSSTGLAGLKCLQWLFRGIEFGCSSIILGIYSYYVATMVNHKMTIPTGVKAVEGISAAGTLYTVLGLLLVCCCAGHPAPSFISMIFDIGLAGAYIYIAVANRDGANSCSSGKLHTVYGSGDAHSTPSSDNGGTKLPTFQVACKMETACLIVSCVAV